MNSTWKIVFKGEALSGYDLFTVKNNFANLYGTTAQDIEKYFSGQAIALKKGLSQEQAEKMISMLSSKGIKAYVESETAEANHIDPSHFGAQANAQSQYTNAQPNDQYSNPNAGQYTQAPQAGQYGSTAQAQNGGGNFNDNYYGSSNTQSEAYNEYSNEIVEPPSFFSLSFEGRYGRLTYINSVMVFMLFAFLIGFAALIVFGASFAMMAGGGASSNALAGMGAGTILIFILFFFLMQVINARYIALRLHDMNLSGWYCLIFVLALPILSMIPLLNILAFFAQLVGVLWLMCVSGTVGANNYGQQPRQGSKAGLIILIICLVLSLLILISSFSLLMAAMSSGQF